MTASGRDDEPTASPDLEAEVLRVGARPEEDEGVRVALELAVENAGAPTRVGAWTVRVRLTDGTTEELPLTAPSEPATFGFPRGGDRAVAPGSVLQSQTPERPIGGGEELAGWLVCEAGGLEPGELLGNGTLYTVSFRVADGGEVTVRHLLSVGPVGGDPAGYFPGLAGT